MSKIKIIPVGNLWIKNTIKILKFNNRNKNIIITGGRYASRIYRKKSFKSIFKNKLLYLSDERLETIKKNTNSFNLNKIINRKLYLPNELKLKNYKNFSFALLSLGEDGHFASIFPGCKKAKSNFNKNYYVTQKKFSNFKRLTFSLKFFINCEKIYMLVNGKSKGRFFDNFIKNYKKKNIHKKSKYFQLSKLVKNTIFLVDKKAYMEIYN